MLWAASLATVELKLDDDLGLVSVLPPTFYIAFLILTVSFSVAVHRRATQGWVLLLHVVVFIVMAHGTPAMLYDTLRYSWTWKHVGIVDYIQRHGRVDPTINFLYEYHNWPGFFALSALITEVSGFESALRFANWGPVFFNLADLGALLIVFRTLTHDRRLVCLGVWFFFLANWVGQDYFSPQALGFFLYLIILGICLGWSRTATPSPSPRLQRLPLIGPAFSMWVRLLAREASRGVPERASQPLERVGLMAVAIISLGIIVISHQLTPLLTFLSLSALVVFQRLRAWGLPVLMAILMVTWLSYMATVFLQDNLGTFAETIGRLFSNVDSNLLDISRASPGQALTARMGRLLTAGMAGLALLGGLRRLRGGYWDVTAALLVIAPMSMLSVSAYEGEMVFRVYLFSLPFVAFFAAAVIYPSLASGATARMVAVTAAISCLILGGFLFAYYGKERLNHFTKYEFDAAQFLYRTAPGGSLLIEGTRNYPSRFMNYEIFSHVVIANEPAPDKLRLIADPASTFVRWMDDPRYSATYLIITRSQKEEVDAVGVMPAGSLARIEEVLKQSPKFKLLYSNEDASIFVLATGRLGAGP